MVELILNLWFETLQMYMIYSHSLHWWLIIIQRASKTKKDILFVALHSEKEK